ncbi:MAG TPA: DegT/DnrJ/EryC1/StrS family aminotransferase [Solirubrobacteraceae bacterium]|nr:DegT/DnrJ/EryC1/StrS family aminotransferase [Solirubrobacteraceae bacterium]
MNILQDILGAPVAKAPHPRSVLLRGQTDPVSDFEQAVVASGLAAGKVPFAVSNGTVAVELAARAVLRAGDLVYVPALTWQGSAWPVILAGGVPILYDSTPGSPLGDLEWVDKDLEERDARGAALPRALVLVDLYELVADRRKAQDIARKWRLTIIADCAHSVGARFLDTPIAAWTPLSTHSYQTSKFLSASSAPGSDPAEGGLVLADPFYATDIGTQVSCGRRPAWAGPEWRPMQAGNNRMPGWTARALTKALKEFPARHAKAVATLNELRALKIPGFAPVSADPRASGCVYKHVRLYSARSFSGLSARKFARALSEMLQTEVVPPYEPLTHCAVYTPHTCPALTVEQQRAVDPRKYSAPWATYWHNNALCLEYAFLETEGACEQLQEAVERIRARADALVVADI